MSKHIRASAKSTIGTGRILERVIQWYWDEILDEVLNPYYGKDRLMIRFEKFRNVQRFCNFKGVKF